MALTKEQILSAPTLRVEEVPVPEWGDGATVYVRELSGDERDSYDQTVLEREGDLRGLRAEMAALAICDESGKSEKFTEAEVKSLGAKSGAVIDRLFEVIRDLSGMGADAVEEAEKNLQAGQSENSG